MFLPLALALACSQATDLQIIDAAATRLSDDTIEVSFAISHEGEGGEWVDGEELCVQVEFLDEAGELLTDGESCSDQGLEPGDSVEHQVVSDISFDAEQTGSIVISFSALGSGSNHVGDTEELDLP